jgi:hypothetical protein
MSDASIHPREEQIAELTRGHKIPLPPLLDVHLIYIAQMLARAWNDLLRGYRPTLIASGETEVNALMASRLNALLDEDKVWAQLVRNVTRGTESMSYDGSHLEKRPDLSVHLTNRNPSFPLIVECKVIDAPSMKTAELYCVHGLARFVNGEYAWTSREAFMLGYVRDGATILSYLTPFLAESRAHGHPGAYLTQTLPELTHKTSGIELARSRHNRRFRYVGRAMQDKPGAITIWHLWLLSSVCKKRKRKRKKKNDNAIGFEWLPLPTSAFKTERRRRLS